MAPQWNAVCPVSKEHFNHSERLQDWESCPYCYSVNSSYQRMVSYSRATVVDLDSSDDEPPRKPLRSAQSEPILPSRSAPSAMFNPTRPPNPPALRSDRLKGREAQFSMLDGAAAEKHRRAGRREQELMPDSRRKDPFFKVQFTTVLKCEYWPTDQGSVIYLATLLSMPPQKIGKSLSIATTKMPY